MIKLWTWWAYKCEQDEKGKRWKEKGASVASEDRKVAAVMAARGSSTKAAVSAAATTPGGAYTPRA